MKLGRIALISVVSGVLSFVGVGSAIAAPPQPLPPGAIQGTNGGGTPQTTKTSPGGINQSVLPGGYCTTLYAAWSENPVTAVDGYSGGQCTAPISSIGVYAAIYSGSSLKATGADTEYGVAVDGTTARYNCGSGCAFFIFKLTNTQTFYNPSGWGTPVGTCAVVGPSMNCGSVTGGFTW